MNARLRRPDLAQTMSHLKDFQQATVERVHQRFWLDKDAARRFLVADEVGLGKTWVARGVIARTIDHLWKNVGRIDVIYICSNTEIARQNLSRLNVVGGHDLGHADRLTLLPRVIGDLADKKVNFVSFTPGTSFHVDRSGGTADERVLLYWMLAEAWGRDAVCSRKWIRFFQGRSGLDSFERRLRALRSEPLTEDAVHALAADLDTETGPRGDPLTVELGSAVDGFHRLRGKPSEDLSRWRYQLIGKLRQLVAKASVQALEPDLVILDEFQRFKDLLDPTNPGADLAHALFDYPTARVLLLSATPYKMYTLPDEPEGDDHYADFVDTVRFLAGQARAGEVEAALRELRRALLSNDLDTARDAKEQVERELRRIMVRTERLAATPNRDGMLVEKTLPDVRVTPDDVRSFRTVNAVARIVNGHDVFEYWRSAPYVLNLMERYKVKRQLVEQLEAGDPELAAALHKAPGLLRWSDVQRYRRIDPGNAKMRSLVSDVLDRRAWSLAWLPPALPYHTLGGAYADPQLRAFTKRLVFSAWAVAPKAIGVVLSYEAERRIMEAAEATTRRYDGRRASPLLQFQYSRGRYTGMPALAILFPSLVLARAGDPLDIARVQRCSFPLERDDMLAHVRARVAGQLAQLPDPPGKPGEPADQRWYWATPFLLDAAELGHAHNEFIHDAAWGTEEHDGGHSRFEEHLDEALAVRGDQLGRRPDDLTDVIAAIALSGPGVCALRALTRVCGGPEVIADPVVRDAATMISWGLRTLFNQPEIMALLRASEQTEEAYWRDVLTNSTDGCLQSVLDEYVHVLVETEGLADKPHHERAWDIAEVVADALTLRAAPYTVDEIRATRQNATLTTRRARVHLAVRFGRNQSEDAAAHRETQVRRAFNSPFWPFVLASTSVGQEGLDFHLYSHAVVHWNLPGNPVDLEQREGRVHRYKGHAVRKNIAQVYGSQPGIADAVDPWAEMFSQAATDRPDQSSDLIPYWVYAPADGARIERFVPAMPLSRESVQQRRLQRTVGAYRLVFGQPRQDDLLRYLGESDEPLDWLRMDLSP